MRRNGTAVKRRCATYPARPEARARPNRPRKAAAGSCGFFGIRARARETKLPHKTGTKPERHPTRTGRHATVSDHALWRVYRPRHALDAGIHGVAPLALPQLLECHKRDRGKISKVCPLGHILEILRIPPRPTRTDSDDADGKKRRTPHLAWRNAAGPSRPPLDTSCSRQAQADLAGRGQRRPQTPSRPAPTFSELSEPHKRALPVPRGRPGHCPATTQT